MTDSVKLLALVSALCGCGSAPPPLPPSDGRAEIQVSVDEKGYHPAEAQGQKGTPLRLVFTRTTDHGCGQQLVFPDLGIRRDLPLAAPVAVDLVLPESGAVAFTCGMGMYRGSVVVR
jgi:plastocyanin domain-containing protein